jgi:hypothetical protein
MKDKKENPLGGYSTNPAAPNKPVIGGLEAGLTFLSGRNMKSTDVVATGKFNNVEKKWEFSGSDDVLAAELEDLFANQVIGRDARTAGSARMPINSMQYVSYMKDVILPRKKLFLKWEIKS